MYLRHDDAIAEVEDSGDAAGQAPELPFPVPLSAGCLDDGVQRLLVGLGLDEDHFRRTRPDGLAAHDKFNSGVADLAFGIASMPDADQSVSVASGQLDCTSVCRCQGLDDAVSGALCLHLL